MTKLMTTPDPTLRGHGYEKANICMGCGNALRATAPQTCGEPAHYHMGVDADGYPAPCCCACASASQALVAAQPKLNIDDDEDDSAEEGGDTDMATKTKDVPAKEADARTTAMQKALKKGPLSVMDLSVAAGMSYNAAKRRLLEHPELFTKVGRTEGWGLATNGAAPAAKAERKPRAKKVKAEVVEEVTDEVTAEAEVTDEVPAEVTEELTDELTEAEEVGA